MQEVRKPVQCAVTLESRSTLNSSHTTSAKIIPSNKACQHSLAPNYCDHAPSVPKLFIVPANHKPRAKVVQETNNKLAQAYGKPKSSLKTLQFHDATGHRVKSQRREAAIALLQVMNYYQDDATGRIGRSLQDGTFCDMTLETLAQKAGIAYRRAKRALTDIVRAGYLRVTKQFVRNANTGEVRGLASIRSFLPKFFIDLDVKGEMWTKWFTQRGWAKERMEKKVNKEDRKKSRAMIGLIKEQVGAIGRSARKKIMGIVNTVPSVPSQKEIDKHIAHKKMLYGKALELFGVDSSKSLSEHYAALQKSHLLK